MLKLYKVYYRNKAGRIDTLFIEANDIGGVELKLALVYKLKSWRSINRVKG